MRLTQFTDYAPRTLIYAAIKGEPVSLDAISGAYGISRNHLIKAVNTLEKNGFINTKRGRGGGITLARAPEEINLWDVVKCTEPSFEIVECFNEERNTCPIAGCCSLEGILGKATQSFIQEVAAHSLADVVKNKRALLDAMHEVAKSSA